VCVRNACAGVLHVIQLATISFDSPHRRIVGTNLYILYSPRPRIVGNNLYAIPTLASMRPSAICAAHHGRANTKITARTALNPGAQPEHTRRRIFAHPLTPANQPVQILIDQPPSQPKNEPNKKVTAVSHRASGRGPCCMHACALPCMHVLSLARICPFLPDSPCSWRNILLRPTSRPPLRMPIAKRTSRGR